MKRPAEGLRLSAGSVFVPQAPIREPGCESSLLRADRNAVYLVADPLGGEIATCVSAHGDLFQNRQGANAFRRAQSRRNESRDHRDNPYPAGFFALVVLVAEALLGISATVLREDVDPVYVLAVMVALIFFLIVLVATFALARPEALYGRRLEPAAPAVADQDLATEQVWGSRILCASTMGCSAEEIGRYADEVSRHFADVSVLRELSLDALRLALSGSRFHLVHLVTAVGVEGTLCVGDQRIPVGEFRDLLDMSSVRLVVLTACDSLPFACELARVANVIVAPTTAVRSDVLRWTDTFYQRLARGLSISRAYSASSGVSRAPVMLLLTKEVTFSH